MAGVTAFVEVVDPFVSVLGYVTSFIGIFKPNPEYKEILKQLDIIEKQIDFLQHDMEMYFNKVMDAVTQDTCYTTYSKYEQLIINANKMYNTYLANLDSPAAEVYLQSFTDMCSNAKCDIAT